MNQIRQSVLRSPGFVEPVKWLTKLQASQIKRKTLALHQNTGFRLFQDSHLFFKWVADAVSHSLIVDQVSNIIGDDIAIEATYIVIKPEKTEFAVPLHQDGIDSNLDLDPEKSVSAWLAITESTVTNGCLRVYSGTHANGYREFRIADSDANSLSGGRPTEMAGSECLPIPTDVPLAQGFGCLFNVCLVHDSKGNGSNKPRIGLNVRYISVGALRKFTDRVRPVLIVRGSANYPSTIAQYPTWSDESGLERLMKCASPTGTIRNYKLI
ncbi:MAG: phytanoyl-CoA dioxygenase family protein [Candidatus Obscuribacterales bacterium]|nr:phytanoyl-CoA dioxygenase family protein [Candidatus Obscuribacterales bacterium]